MTLSLSLQLFLRLSKQRSMLFRRMLRSVSWKLPARSDQRIALQFFAFFAKAKKRSMRNIFSAAPEAASAQEVAVEEASEPKGYNYPVPGTHTWFIQKLDRKILWFAIWSDIAISIFGEFEA